MNVWKKLFGTKSNDEESPEVIKFKECVGAVRLKMGGSPSDIEDYFSRLKQLDPDGYKKMISDIIAHEWGKPMAKIEDTINEWDRGIYSGGAYY